MRAITRYMLYSVLCLGTLFFILEQIPIKRVVVIDDINNFPAIVCRRAHSTGPPWALMQDKEGVYSRTKLVILEGKTPEELIDTFFVDAINYFIIKGEITGEKEHEYGEPGKKYDVIYSEDRDIIYPVDRGNSLRLFASKMHLSIFVFRWFITHNM